MPAFITSKNSDKIYFEIKFYIAYYYQYGSSSDNCC